MKPKQELTICIACVCFLAVCLGANGQTDKDNSFNTLTSAELQQLLLDVAKTNPQAFKRFKEDPELKKEQLKSLRQLLAFASQAQKEGLTKDPIQSQELENIRSEVTAVNYDKEVNKNRKPMPAFGYITDAQVAAFWAKAGNQDSLLREREFAKFMDTKLALIRSGNPSRTSFEPSDEERSQAREFYAKVKIYESEFDSKLASLPKDLIDRTELQIKLQQAQLLAKVYSEKIAAKVAVADSEVDSYISAHPEFDLVKKKAKAEEILSRAKAGEDFAKLANEFSEDPGNKGPNGLRLGGIYRDIPKGRMLSAFESAAISLQPGQIYPNVVETDYGYHIIKLEKKNSSNDLYDARHILILTTVPDPSDPDAGAKPVKTFVRGKLESEKEDRLIKKLVAENNVQVPDDFTLPETVSGSKTVKAAAKRKPTVHKPATRKRR